MGEEDKKKEKEEVVEIVLKVDMHCDACARKIARSLKGFEGVEEVTADCKASKVVVKGKSADPSKILDRIQKKCSRKVELISPAPKPPADNKPPKVKDEPPKEDKKDEPPAVGTVVLSVRMHCEACALVLQKRIQKIKGVESVTTDLTSNQVKITGAVEPEKLVEEVFKKTKKRGTIVKEKEKKEEGKKAEEKEDAKEKKDAQEPKEEQDDKKMDVKKSEHWPAARYNMDFAYAPQIFSDENPNACSVM